MVRVGMHEAKTQLSRLVALAESGEEIIIQRSGRSVARLVAVEPRRPVADAFGVLRGQIELADDFEELPAEARRPLPLSLLLDTHAVLWLLAGDSRVDGVRAAIGDPRTRVLLSAVCVWEAAIKSALGKLRIPDDLVDRLDEFGFESLPVTGAHAWAVRRLPPIHNDPFDRLLAAQAVCERATIVSADPVFDAYAIERIW